MSDDEAWLGPMTQKFLARLSDERAALLELAELGGWDQIIDRAHKLAGIAGMLGAPQVGEAALCFEETARADSPCDAEFAALIAAIEAAIS
ncbi:MAG: Hpt domain-containing protein [Erythrobacter sp.]